MLEEKILTSEKEEKEKLEKLKNLPEVKSNFEFWSNLKTKLKLSHFNFFSYDFKSSPIDKI